MMSATANKHRDDPVLVLARRMPGEGAGWAWFGIHDLEDPTYSGDGWDEPYTSSVCNPFWRGDVLRVVWTGSFLLPDERDLAEVPTPEQINAERLPWLASALTGFTDTICAGMPLSRFVPEVVRLAGGVYVPIDGIGAKTWQEWDAVRAAAFKAGRYIEEPR